jgi:hypothetical protein
MKTKVRNFGAAALLVVFSLIGNAVFANNGNGDTPAAQLKYIGSIGHQPLFQLNLDGVKEAYYYISIKDQKGQELYSEKVKAKTFTRTFRLDTEDIGDAVLTVEVRSSGSNKPEVFTINRKTRFVEENSVSKL